jgi:hypothetical protein
VQAGEQNLDGLTAYLDKARDIGDRVGRALDARAEVDAVLEPGR